MMGLEILSSDWLALMFVAGLILGLGIGLLAAHIFGRLLSPSTPSAAKPSRRYHLTVQQPFKIGEREFVPGEIVRISELYPFRRRAIKEHLVN